MAKQGGRGARPSSGVSTGNIFTGRDVNIARGNIYHGRGTADTDQSSTAVLAASPAAGASVFISHINEEVAAALLLKEWIEGLFGGIGPVFVSGAPDSIPAGEKWLTRIEEALGSVRILLALASRAAIARPWVNFEVGAAWARGIPIVFLCHSGLGPADLPDPYRGRQSLSLDADGSVLKLFERMKDLFGRERLPPLNFSGIERELRARL